MRESTLHAEYELYQTDSHGKKNMSAWLREQLYATLTVVLRAKLKNQVGKNPFLINQSLLNNWRSMGLMEQIQDFLLAGSAAQISKELHQMICWLSSRTEDKRDTNFWTCWKRAWGLQVTFNEQDQFGREGRLMNLQLFEMAFHADFELMKRKGQNAAPATVRAFVEIDKEDPLANFSESKPEI